VKAAHMHCTVATLTPTYRVSRFAIGWLEFSNARLLREPLPLLF
jgi:hypothetical protein